MRIAALAMTAGTDPAVNARTLSAAVADAAAGGAAMLFTPEMSGLLDRDASRAREHVGREADDPVLRQVREAARAHAIWVALGSLAVVGDDGRWRNRSVVIDAAGQLRARYDKLHLFDVDVGTGDRWRESARYAPGEEAVAVDTPVGRLGLSVCYDLRFPALYTALSAAGATVLAVPAAFTVPTGRAHWHTLLRARAIENACWVVASAQCGRHADGRETYGHTLVIDPWGTVRLDLGETIGVGFTEIQPDAVAAARARVPVIEHRRDIGPVQVLTRPLAD